MCTHTHTHTHTYTHTYIHTYTHTHIHTCVYASKMSEKSCTVMTEVSPSSYTSRAFSNIPRRM